MTLKSELAAADMFGSDYPRDQRAELIIQFSIAGNIDFETAKEILANLSDDEILERIRNLKTKSLNDEA